MMNSRIAVGLDALRKKRIETGAERVSSRELSNAEIMDALRKAEEKDRLAKQAAAQKRKLTEFTKSDDPLVGSW